MLFLRELESENSLVFQELRFPKIKIRNFPRRDIISYESLTQSKRYKHIESATSAGKHRQQLERDDRGRNLTETQTILDTAYEDNSANCVLRLCLFALCWDFAKYLIIAPLTETIEDIICRQYYARTPEHTVLAQNRCKVNHVQNELALLKGYQDALSQIPGQPHRCLYPPRADNVATC